MRFVSSAASLLAILAVVPSFADDWPEWRGKGRRGEYKESGILETFPPGGLKVKWRTPIHAGYTGPAVAGGRVFVTDFRMVMPGEGPPAPPEMNMRRATGLIGVERALAVEEATGKILWTREWDADYTGIMQSYAIGPRSTPTVDGDRVYVQTTMGRLLCLNAATGTVLWQKDYQKEFGLKVPVWGMTAAPLVDGPRVVAVTGGPDGGLVALDKLTGKVLWKAVSLSASGPGYSSPFLLEAGGARQLVYWHPRGVASVDPVSGESLWDQEWKQTDTGLVVATPVHQKNWLLMSSFYKGSLMLELDPEKPKAKLAWKGTSESEIDTDGLHSITSTPVIDGDYIYGVCSYGQLRCLQASTGKRVWETQAVTKEKARWASAFLVRHGDRYFINNDRGDLIIARLSPEGYEEIARTTLIKPTATAGIGRREMKAVNWTHPAYANRTLYTRNDEELIAVSLSK
jgi:outer membrane protein assembly factor BamB